MKKLILSISKLHIFSKKTDATASLRGYLYQVLKTVETWVDNFNNDVDDEIYCDFEEDIFQKNQLSKTAKFRQIKLYSSNFSFASEEIQKCIAHFFMLHVKTDYKSLEKEFVFEANTSVAQKKGENDAELLKKWNEHQDNLDDELLKQCVVKVKSIVSAYVEEQAKALAGKEEEATIKEAITIFESLKEEDWIEFTKSIKWKFNNTAPEIEFAALKENIEHLILKLPFPIDKKNISATFGLLHTTAWEKASIENPDERKLTLPELKQILLEASNDNDKWYWQVFERWDDITSINQFIIGEFYEVIDATRHCRQHPYLLKHDKQWLSILKIYIDKIEMPDDYRRTAIYEYLWLRFKPINYYTKPAGDLIGEGQYLETYFKDFSAFRNADELEDAQSLMNIALAATYLSISDLTGEQVNKWYHQMEEILIERLKTEKNPNEICHLLENLGTHYLFLNARQKEEKSVTQVITPLEEIFSHIDKADLYNATGLSTRLNKYINLLIEIDAEENYELIEAIEIYSEKLNPIVEKRHGSYKAAKVEVEKGMQYLKSSNPILLLNALNCFHKAKTLWYQQEAIEGFVLSLINISQLYSAIGMNLAAKYYALAAAWASIHNGSRHLLKRIADSFGLIFYADFKQGAWMNAIVSFADYMNARNEFKGTPLDPETDKMAFKVMGDLAIILHSTPKLSPQLSVLVDAHIGMLGQLGEDFIKPLFPDLENDYPTDTSLKALLEGKLTDRPLNDAGKLRLIRFNALGSSWEISFSNDYETTPIAEEFCGIMQVMLAEIALSKSDFHLVRSSLIKIDLEIKQELTPSEQLPSHTKLKWKVFVEYFDSAVPQEINFHTAKISVALMNILDEISLLPAKEFTQLFEKLFKENDLAGKALALGAYQRMYRYVFKKPRFDSLQRQFFEPVNIPFLDLPMVNSVMEWKSDFSKKYSQKEAIENIENRFRNSNPCIYLTIEKLKKDKNFTDFVNDLRSKGWLDWQIVLTIMNFMLNYKTHREISNQSFETEERYQTAYNELFHKFRYKDEKDCYIEFPLEAFHSKEFQFQLNHTLVTILKSYGLENKSRFPNFTAVKEFLDIRFNMQVDKTDSGNILIDV